LALEAEKQNLEEARRKEAQRKKAEEEKRLRAEAEAKKKAKEQKTAAAVKTKPGMVKIPAGKFWMGCNEKVDTQCLDREKPGRTVSVDAFQIDTTEVTVKAYRSCVESGKCSDKGLTTYNSCNWDKPGRDDHPVNCVTWNQARTYCEAVGKRLPTEAEWEKAARGEKDWTYPWGNEWDKTKANTEEGGKGGTVAVGSYDLGVSPDGVHDMAGNVLEWVQDWYAADYYQKGPDRKPTGPNSGKQRSVRGGSWAYGQRAARVAYRLRLTSGDIYGFIGFRCASS
jgi:formylglycine-generating enzyme required for sulfatase activity